MRITISRISPGLRGRPVFRFLEPSYLLAVKCAKPRQDGPGLHDVTARSALAWRQLLALHCQAAPLFGAVKVIRCDPVLCARASLRMRISSPHVVHLARHAFIDRVGDHGDWRGRVEHQMVT